MEDILDSVRKIIFRWVNTFTPITVGVDAGDYTIKVNNSYRFQPNDQVMLRNGNYYETGLVIDSVDDAYTITMKSAILNDWSAGDEYVEETILMKTPYEMWVQGIHIGDPDVMFRYPAITVNGTTRSSEWLTIESTKERYEIEIGIYVKDSSHEQGYRFLMNLVKIIQTGLKRNLIPLVNDYDIISLAEDVNVGDVNIRLSDRAKLGNYRRLMIENEYDMQEVWVDHIYPTSIDPSNESVHLDSEICCNFRAFDTSVVIPHRFVFNSWPATIEYGKIHKGELLKAAVIRWFAEEEEMQVIRRAETKLG